MRFEFNLSIEDAQPSEILHVIRRIVAMANLSEAQVARLEKDINQVGTDIGTAVADLKAAIASGTGDPQPLLDRIDKAGAALEALDLTVKADDPGPIVPPAPPVPAPTPGT